MDRAGDVLPDLVAQPLLEVPVAAEPETRQEAKYGRSTGPGGLRERRRGDQSGARVVGEQRSGAPTLRGAQVLDAVPDDVLDSIDVSKSSDNVCPPVTGQPPVIHPERVQLRSGW